VKGILVSGFIGLAAVIIGLLVIRFTPEERKR
jgi:hypothetical protein